MGYIDAAYLKRYLSIGTDDDDAILSEFIDVASERVDDITHTRFGVATDETRVFSSLSWGNGRWDGQTVWFDGLLAQITSLEVNGVQVPDADYYLKPVNDGPYSCLAFNYDAEIRIPERTNAIRVTGRWGYSVDIPAPVRQATARMAAYWYRERDSQEFEVVGDSMGQQTVPPRDVPVGVMRLLKPYAQTRVFPGVGRL